MPWSVFHITCRRASNNHPFLRLPGSCYKLAQPFHFIPGGSCDSVTWLNIALSYLKEGFCMHDSSRSACFSLQWRDPQIALLWIQIRKNSRCPCVSSFVKPRTFAPVVKVNRNDKSRARWMQGGREMHTKLCLGNLIEINYLVDNDVDGALLK